MGSCATGDIHATERPQHQCVSQLKSDRTRVLLTDSLDQRDLFQPVPGVSPYRGRYVKPWPNVQTRDEDDDFYTCADSCSPPFENAPTRRDALELSVNGTLVPRVLTEPGVTEDMDTWMVAQVPRAHPIVWRIQRGTDINTAIIKEFGNRAVSISTNGLCGCTSLWIISRKGVYATHYWESISFAPDVDQRLTARETNKQVFERTVLEPLRHGMQINGRKAQDALDPAIADDHTKAYIVHPERSCGPRSRPDGYRNQWNEIKRVVGEIIPALEPNANAARWEEVEYIRNDRDDMASLFGTASGHVLFKYDPDAHGDGEGKKKAVLWVEAKKEPWHNDEW